MSATFFIQRLQTFFSPRFFTFFNVFFIFISTFITSTAIYEHLRYGLRTYPRITLQQLGTDGRTRTHREQRIKSTGSSGGDIVQNRAATIAGHPSLGFAMYHGRSRLSQAALSSGLVSEHILVDGRGSIFTLLLSSSSRIYHLNVNAATTVQLHCSVIEFSSVSRQSSHCCSVINLAVKYETVGYVRQIMLIKSTAIFRV